MLAINLREQPTRRARISYHTSVKLAYRMGGLPRETLARIPRSTRHAWRGLRPTDFFGGDDDEALLRFEMTQQIASSRHLTTLVRALLRIATLYRAMLERTRGGRLALKHAREKIVRLVQRFESQLPRRVLLRRFRVSPQRFGYWLRNRAACLSLPAGLCRPRHPTQLLVREAQSVREYLTNAAYATWTGVAVYYQMLRDGVLQCGLSTFYETARHLGLSRRREKHRRPATEGVRADTPGQIIHTDITHTRLTDGTRVHIYNTVDNYSRYWLASHASLTKTAVENRANIERVLAEHAGLWPESLELWVDDGSENAGALLELANASGGRVRHMVAQRTVRFSNSMVEAINRVLKSTYLRERRFDTLDGLQQFLNAARTDYNARPHGALFGLRPEEVLAGTLPDPRRFLGGLREARAARVAGNRTFDCKACRESDGATPAGD